MGTVSTMSCPRQDVQPTVTGNSKPQQGNIGTPYRFHIKTSMHHVDSNHYKKTVEEQTKRDARDETRLKVEKWALIVGFFGFAGLLYTLDLARKDFGAEYRAWIVVTGLFGQSDIIAGNQEDQSGGILPPGSSSQVDFTIGPFTEGQLISIKMKQTFLLILGGLRYSDRYEKVRYSTLCFLYNPDIAQFSVCPGGNTAP